jgi:hypothetical protein
VQLTPGTRLRSAVCAGQLVVVRAPANDVDLRFGGVPVSDLDNPVEPLVPRADRMGETPMGKRYTDVHRVLEVLVTHTGQTLLSLGDDLLIRKDTKNLPASD